MNFIFQNAVIQINNIKIIVTASFNMGPMLKGRKANFYFLRYLLANRH